MTFWTLLVVKYSLKNKLKLKSIHDGSLPKAWGVKVRLMIFRSDSTEENVEKYILFKISYLNYYF